MNQLIFIDARCQDGGTKKDTEKPKATFSWFCVCPVSAPNFGPKLNKVILMHACQDGAGKKAEKSKAIYLRCRARNSGAVQVCEVMRFGVCAHARSKQQLQDQMRFVRCPRAADIRGLPGWGGGKWQQTVRHHVALHVGCFCRQDFSSGSGRKENEIPVKDLLQIYEVCLAALRVL